MKKLEFQRKIKVSRKPVIVDLWAPWCKPCKAMEPGFKEVAAKYTGKVEVLKINADESTEVLQELHVMGIPTVIGFLDGKEIVRKTGYQSAGGLEAMFEAAISGQKPAVMPPAPIDRLIRTLLGAAIIIAGWFITHSFIPVVLGAIVVFTGYYDRCPVFKAVSAQLKKRFQHSAKETLNEGE
jgi:Thioredoxin domain-containing protein